MKVILSRKGFDSEFGGSPSPILADGSLISLPIPTSSDTLTYRDLRFGDGNYGRLMERLGLYGMAERTCHLDPDLVPAVTDRAPGWRPMFGQLGAAGSHLHNQGVGPGDLFLFFGWFQRTLQNGKYDPGDGTGRHVIFGYMEVAEVHRVTAGVVLPPWMEQHPHSSPARRDRPSNTIYVARPTLSWNPELPGAGTLRFHDGLVLTAPGCTRSRWALPIGFKGLTISYHTEKAWKLGYFQSQAKGQEFVIQESEVVTQWARTLIDRGLHKHEI